MLVARKMTPSPPIHSPVVLISELNSEGLLQLEKSIAKLGDVDSLATTVRALQSRTDELEQELAAAVRRVDSEMHSIVRRQSTARGSVGPQNWEN